MPGIRPTYLCTPCLTGRRGCVPGPFSGRHIFARRALKPTCLTMRRAAMPTHRRGRSFGSLGPLAGRSVYADGGPPYLEADVSGEPYSCLWTADSLRSPRVDPCLATPAYQADVWEGRTVWPTLRMHPDEPRWCDGWARPSQHATKRVPKLGHLLCTTFALMMMRRTVVADASYLTPHCSGRRGIHRTC